MGRATLDGEPRGIGTGYYCRACLVVDNLKADSSNPLFRTRVAKIGGDGNLRIPTCEIGNGFGINTLYKSSRCNEQLHWPVDASVMRPITGTSSRHHMLIECIVNSHCNGVGTSQAQQVSDIKHECGVAFADMVSGQLPIYPDFGCVEYGLKLESYRRVLPITRRVESSLIPGDPSIVGKGGVYLPSVRHIHPAPKTGRFVGFVPTLLLTGDLGIGAKPPFAAGTHCFPQGYVRRVRARRRCRRGNSARGQSPGLSQEFPTRMHRYTPQFGPICRVFVLQTKGEFPQTK